jgi:hypothetical protein
VSGDARALSASSLLQTNNVLYGDTSGGNGCNFDYVRIPGGSESGTRHTSRHSWPRRYFFYFPLSIG